MDESHRLQVLLFGLCLILAPLLLAMATLFWDGGSVGLTGGVLTVYSFTFWIGAVCGCIDVRPWDEVATSDVLFLGQLVKVERVHVVEFVPWIQIPGHLFRFLEPNHTAFVFEVERWWNGRGKRQERVITDFSSCERPAQAPGLDMLVEAWTTGARTSRGFVPVRFRSTQR